MDQYQDVGVILLHGLPLAPESDGTVQNPCDKLNALKQELELVVPQSNIDCYCWAEDIPLRMVAEPSFYMSNLAKRGRLGEEGQKVFDQRLHSDKYFYNREISRWIIGGYSAGGWILNDWLFGCACKILRGDADARKDLDRIVFAFTIGAPFQNDFRTCWLGDPPQFIDGLTDWKLTKHHPLTIPVQTQKLDPEWVNSPQSEYLVPEVLAYTLGPKRYCTVWSHGDVTVRPGNSKLPDHLIDDNVVLQRALDSNLEGVKDTELEARGELYIHLELPAREEVLEFIRSSMQIALNDP